MSRPAIRRIQKTIATLRTAWLVFGLTLLLLLALEFGLRGLFTVKDRLMKPTPPDPRVLRDGYGGATWPIQHYRELEAVSQRWEPYSYFRQRAFRGETINIDDHGRRATWRPPVAERGAKPLKILFFGGSTFWGFGSRDEKTIPSLLLKSLHDEGIAAEPRNLAEIGYVNTQELVALVRQLQSGYRPDLVIFFDGANDASSAMLQRGPSLSMAESNRAREFNLLQSPGRLTVALAGDLIRKSAIQRAVDSARLRLLGLQATSQPARTDSELDALAQGVVEGYLANLDIIENLGERYGFQPVFVWQPVAFAKARPTDFEREEAAKLGWLAPLFARVADEIDRSEALKARRNFINLSDVFGDSPDLLFIDYCHLTEEGNARVSRAIFERLGESLPATTEAPD